MLVLQSPASLHHRTLTAATRAESVLRLRTVGVERVREATVANTVVEVVAMVVVGAMIVDASADVMAILSCVVVVGAGVVKVVVRRKARDPG